MIRPSLRFHENARKQSHETFAKMLSSVCENALSIVVIPRWVFVIGWYGVLNSLKMPCVLSGITLILLTFSSIGQFLSVAFFHSCSKFIKSFPFYFHVLCVRRMHWTEIYMHESGYLAFISIALNRLNLDRAGLLCFHLVLFAFNYACCCQRFTWQCCLTTSSLTMKNGSKRPTSHKLSAILQM